MSLQRHCDCEFCLFMWLNPEPMWEPKDRLIYVGHLKIRHGWKSQIEP